MEGGYVFSWGTGYLGQLGLGDDCSWDSPRLIKSLDPAKLGENDTSLWVSFLCKVFLDVFNSQTYSSFVCVLN